MREINKLLISGCYDGDLNKVKEAIEKGADVNYRSFGSTALSIALEKRHIDIVKFLTKHQDIDIDKRYSCCFNGTLLRYAAVRGYIDGVKILLEGGACVDIKDDFGHLPAFYDYSKNDITNLLKQYEDTNLTSVQMPIREKKKQANQLLIEGYCSRDLDKMQEALKNGANVDYRDSKGRTSLYIAMAGNYVEGAELLLKNGACLDIPDHRGITSFMASRKSNQDMLTLVQKYENTNRSISNQAENIVDDVVVSISSEESYILEDVYSDDDINKNTDSTVVDDDINKNMDSTIVKDTSGVVAEHPVTPSNTVASCITENLHKQKLIMV
ncbi:ankyrin repeat domain-containing protein [Wolbachia endosymbiont of Pentidionis agamae]|uniref:ankyrin repeat domain-containing protein n=1 Tax=Wolbachia endosymbiont of Pentidionis agamae TaxID=3110435 RepID=UPI002FD714B3